MAALYFVPVPLPLQPNPDTKENEKEKDLFVFSSVILSKDQNTFVKWEEKGIRCVALGRDAQQQQHLCATLFFPSLGTTCTFHAFSVPRHVSPANIQPLVQEERNTFFFARTTTRTELVEQKLDPVECDLLLGIHETLSAECIHIPVTFNFLLCVHSNASSSCSDPTWTEWEDIVYFFSKQKWNVEASRLFERLKTMYKQVAWPASIQNCLFQPHPTHPQEWVLSFVYAFWFCPSHTPHACWTWQLDPLLVFPSTDWQDREFETKTHPTFFDKTKDIRESLWSTHTFQEKWVYRWNQGHVEFASKDCIQAQQARRKRYGGFCHLDCLDLTDSNSKVVYWISESPPPNTHSQKNMYECVSLSTFCETLVPQLPALSQEKEVVCLFDHPKMNVKVADRLSREFVKRVQTLKQYTCWILGPASQDLLGLFGLPECDVLYLQQNPLVFQRWAQSPCHCVKRGQESPKVHWLSYQPSFSVSPSSFQKELQTSLKRCQYFVCEFDKVNVQDNSRFQAIQLLLHEAPSDTKFVLLCSSSFYARLDILKNNPNMEVFEEEQKLCNAYRSTLGSHKQLLFWSMCLTRETFELCTRVFQTIYAFEEPKWDRMIWKYFETIYSLGTLSKKRKRKAIQIHEEKENAHSGSLTLDLWLQKQNS